MSASRLKPGSKIVKFGEVVRNTNLVEKVLGRSGIDKVVGLDHIDSENLHIRRWDSLQNGTSFSRKFLPGQTLFGKRRAYQRKVAYAEFEGVCSGDILVFESKDKKLLLPELLPFICQTEAFYNYALKTSAGSLSPRTSWKALQDFIFPLPPIEEQKGVAEVLWAADDIIESFSRLYDNIVTIFNLIIETRLIARSTNSTLEDYCVSNGVKIGPFGSLLHAEDYSNEGVPVVMPTDIADNRILESSISHVTHKKAKELNTYSLCENDILFPRRGDLTKRAIVLKHQEGWLCGTGTIRVRLRKGIDPQIVFVALTSRSINNWLDRYSVGTTMQNLNASTIKRIPFQLPDDSSSGNLSKVLSSASHVKEQTRKHLLALATLRGKLITKFLNASGPNPNV